MNDPEHFVHVRKGDGSVKTMNFRGGSVPRIGDRIKLHSATQGIDDEYRVVYVRWMITNAGSTRNRYVSDAQAEVWVEPPKRANPPGRSRGVALVVSVVAFVAYFILTMWVML